MVIGNILNKNLIQNIMGAEYLGQIFWGKIIKLIFIEATGASIGWTGSIRGL